MLPIIMSLHFSGCAAVSHSIGMTFHIMLLSFTATLGISALVWHSERKQKKLWRFLSDQAALCCFSTFLLQETSKFICWLGLEKLLNLHWGISLSLKVISRDGILHTWLWNTFPSWGFQKGNTIYFNLLNLVFCCSSRSAGNMNCFFKIIRLPVAELHSRNFEVWRRGRTVLDYQFIIDRNMKSYEEIKAGMNTRENLHW